MNSTERGPQPRPKATDKLSQLIEFASSKRAKVVASTIYLSNFLFHRANQDQGIITSVGHGVTSVFNSPMYSPRLNGELATALYSGSQSLMYVAVGVGATSAVSKLVEKDVRAREGRSAINRSNSVILADAGGLPIFVDLGSQIGRSGEPKNIVLSKTATSPERTAQEQDVFGVWIANAGGPERAFFNTEFWLRSGAKKADAVVLNSSNLTSSKEAAIVIREQVGNLKAEIFIITDEDSDTETDSRTGAHIVNPYEEVVNILVNNLILENGGDLVPEIYLSKTEIEKRRNVLKAKLQKLKNNGLDVKIFINGETAGPEGSKIRAAFAALEKADLLTEDPSIANVVMYFGNEDVLDDASVMEESNADLFRYRDDVVKIRVPFARDSEDNALNHADGTISLERATNDKLQTLIEPKIKRKKKMFKRAKSIN